MLKNTTTSSEKKWTNMHTVKRAIIMAAGIGKRMHPVTFHTPKPLISVNGVVMIESIIEGLQYNGIKEIHIVVGYLKEQFKYLTEKYNNVELIENPFYDTCNNISSLYVARDYLDDCIILDGDQLVYNNDILKPEFKRSGYNAVYVESHTDEWLMTLNEEGIVTECSRTGGEKGWQLYSISRWSHDDGIKLKHYLEYEFERGNNQIYWDDVAMFCHFEDFKLGVYEMKKNDIREIDDFEELVELDSSYSKWRGTK